ncbi:MAG: iron uptake transporter deferrochelatase/peroxidase subunit [Ancalomicrobiaceae bacterium]|nr:iron uptake transporter deferrochelatase/peroxidase subunit [Ancalomicrobiaceae bacterium]
MSEHDNRSGCPFAFAAAKPSRRGLLTGLAAFGGLTIDGSLSADAAVRPHRPIDAAASGRHRLRFHGRHQAGVVTPQQAHGMVVAFDVLATSRDELQEMFKRLTERIRFLMHGGTPEAIDPKFPPPDSGIVGPVIQPDDLSITASVGASLFDGRFGLAARKPRQLVAMAGFPNDSLQEELCHGDLMLQICASGADTVIHALRDIIKTTPDQLAVRWMQDGFLPVEPLSFGHAPAQPTPRNLLGFKDGTANLRSTDPELMDRHVWVKPGSDEPRWAAGGTYQVVRIIRQFVERWDRTPLQEQEGIIGRDKATGAPLGRSREHDDPAYASDPKGLRIPLDAHIRLANPRTTETASSLLLRRGYNYSRSVTASGQLDMGLLFVCFQADLESGFLAVQRRLNGEPLEEYINPVGGGYFFVLPGVATDAGYLADGLLTPQT